MCISSYCKLKKAYPIQFMQISVHAEKPHMGQFLQDGKNEQTLSKKKFFWSSTVTKRFDRFNFSQLFWRDFALWISKYFLKKLFFSFFRQSLLIFPVLQKLTHMHIITYMSQFPQDGDNGQNVAFCSFFGALLWPNGFIFLLLLLLFSAIAVNHAGDYPYNDHGNLKSKIKSLGRQWCWILLMQLCMKHANVPDDQ